MATVQHSISSLRQLPALPILLYAFSHRFLTFLRCFSAAGGGKPAPKAHSPAARTSPSLHAIPRYSLFLPCSVPVPNLYLYDFPRCHLIRRFCIPAQPQPILGCDYLPARGHTGAWCPASSCSGPWQENCNAPFTNPRRPSHSSSPHLARARHRIRALHRLAVRPTDNPNTNTPSSGLGLQRK